MPTWDLLIKGRPASGLPGLLALRQYAVQYAVGTQQYSRQLSTVNDANTVSCGFVALST